LSNHIATQVLDGGDTDKLLRQVAAYLIETGRTKETDLIVRDVEAALSERGHVLARIITARPLSDKQVSAVPEQIKSQTKAKSVELDLVVDESVIGGIRIELPGYESDSTLRRRLNALTSKKNSKLTVRSR